MRPALTAARDALEGASLPVLQRVLEALEGRHAGPITRMRARTRARAHAIPPPLPVSYTHLTLPTSDLV